MIASEEEVKFEPQQFPDFPREIMAIPGCEKLESCIQCGACSGVCPLSIYIDYTPRRVIQLIRFGFRDEVLRSNSIWICSSCYFCTVECPKEIKITDIMNSLKQRAIQQGIYPRGFPIPVLAEDFYKMVRSRGRTTVTHLVMSLYMKTNIIRLLKMWGLGLRLSLKGRFAFKSASIKRREELARVLDAVEAEG